MSDPSFESGMDAPPAAQIRRNLEELLAEGEKLKARAQEPAPDLRALLNLPTEGSVTIVRDERGLFEDMIFDHVGGKRAAPAELLQQINIALFSGSAAGFTLGASPDYAEALQTNTPGQLHPQLRDLMTTLESGKVPEPESFSSDLKTVTVGARFGEIVSVDCSTSFLEAASDNTLAAEIVRIARDAAVKTDVFGKYANQAKSNDNREEGPTR